MKQQPIFNVLKISKRNEVLFGIVYVISLFSYPLSSYISGFLGIESNILSIGARALTVSSISFYIFFLIRNGLFRPTWVFYLFLVFWIIYAIRIIYDTSTYSWMLGRPTNEYILFAFVLCFTCTIPLYIQVKLPGIILENVVFYLLLLLNLLGLYNNLTADNLFLERLGGNEKLNPIIFGNLASYLLVISFLKFLRFNNSWAILVLLVIAICMALTNLFIAASKSPIIFTILSLFLMTIFYIRKKNIKAVILLILTIAIGISSIFVLGLQDIFLLTLLRFSEISSDNSSVERLDQLMGGLNQFLKNPLFGDFLEERVSREYPHNLVLESFMATGIVGGSLFLCFFIGFIFVTFYNIFKSHLHFMTFIALSALVVSFFSGGLSFSVDFWIAAPIMYAMFFTLRSNKGKYSSSNI
jgi:O-antigen ligase